MGPPCPPPQSSYPCRGAAGEMPALEEGPKGPKKGQQEKKKTKPSRLHAQPSQPASQTRPGLCRTGGGPRGERGSTDGTADHLLFGRQPEIGGPEKTWPKTGLPSWYCPGTRTFAGIVSTRQTKGRKFFLYSCLLLSKWGGGCGSHGSSPTSATSPRAAGEADVGGRVSGGREEVLRI